MLTSGDTQPWTTRGWGSTSPWPFAVVFLGILVLLFLLGVFR